MDFKTLFMLALLIASRSFAQEQDLAPKDQPPPNEEGTYQIERRLTLPGCIEFQWKAADKGKLPTSIKLKNPFNEPLSVASMVHGFPCPDFEIEYYDSYLKHWRRPIGIPGTSGGKRLNVKSGESVVLPVDEGFWQFIRESIPDFKLQDPVRIRLVFDLGGVSLQSPELRWNRANKAVERKRQPDQK